MEFLLGYINCIFHQIKLQKWAQNEGRWSQHNISSITTMILNMKTSNTKCARDTKIHQWKIIQSHAVCYRTITWQWLMQDEN
jgi:hypothetical protein